MKTLVKGGLVEVVQFLGHHILQIWRPLGFALWGYMKAKLFKTKVNDNAGLKERIEQEIKALKEKSH